MTESHVLRVIFLLSIFHFKQKTKKKLFSLVDSQAFVFFQKRRNPLLFFFSFLLQRLQPQPPLSFLHNLKINNPNNTNTTNNTNNNMEFEREFANPTSQVMVYNFVEKAYELFSGAIEHFIEDAGENDNEITYEVADD